MEQQFVNFENVLKSNGIADKLDLEQQQFVNFEDVLKNYYHNRRGKIALFPS
jgi:hypothetical protein